MLCENAHDKWKAGYETVGTVLSQFYQKKRWKDKYQNSGYFWEVGFWRYVLAFYYFYLLLVNILHFQLTMNKYYFYNQLFPFLPLYTFFK